MQHVGIAVMTHFRASEYWYETREAGDTPAGGSLMESTNDCQGQRSQVEEGKSVR